MNKKVLAALVTTLAFGTAGVVRAAEEAKSEPPAKEAKSVKKAGKEDKKGDTTKSVKPTQPAPMPQPPT